MPLVTIKNLGSGGFGVVDLVRSDDGSVFARKTLVPTSTLPPQVVQNIERRFAREAKTQSGITESAQAAVGSRFQRPPHLQ